MKAGQARAGACVIRQARGLRDGSALQPLFVEHAMRFKNL
jgi:hypothetical protein